MEETLIYWLDMGLLPMPGDSLFLLGFLQLLVCLGMTICRISDHRPEK